MPPAGSAPQARHGLAHSEKLGIFIVQMRKRLANASDQTTMAGFSALGTVTGRKVDTAKTLFFDVSGNTQFCFRSVVEGLDGVIVDWPIHKAKILATVP